MLKRISLLFAFILASTGLLVACGGGGSESSTSTDASTDTVGATCETVDAPAPKTDIKLAPPDADAPTAAGVVFDTSCGSFTVTFDERAPKTAASFQYLAEEGLYDDTVFHRVVPGFVIQGGDPLGSDPKLAGTGGPGYSVDEEPPADLAYTKGVVAMAKSEAEPPGRSGSQFYVVTGADAGLPPDYALVGAVTEGMDVVDAISELGQPGADGPPSMPVVINTATPEG